MENVGQCFGTNFANIQQSRLYDHFTTNTPSRSTVRIIRGTSMVRQTRPEIISPKPVRCRNTPHPKFRHISKSYEARSTKEVRTRTNISTPIQEEDDSPARPAIRVARRDLQERAEQ